MRRFLPAFSREAASDLRHLAKPMVDAWRLRSPWMKTRLLRMAAVLGRRGESMTGYTDSLRRLESAATSMDPTPALDAIVRDHGGGGQKTLSIFVRDCVGGNSFPNDSRVESVLSAYDLPHEELPLVRACLALELNPRNVARIFYDAGGQGSFFSARI